MSTGRTIHRPHRPGYAMHRIPTSHSSVHGRRTVWETFWHEMFLQSTLFFFDMQHHYDRFFTHKSTWRFLRWEWWGWVKTIISIYIICIDASRGNEGGNRINGDQEDIPFNSTMARLACSELRKDLYTADNRTHESQQRSDRTTNEKKMIHVSDRSKMIWKNK